MGIFDNLFNPQTQVQGPGPIPLPGIAPAQMPQRQPRFKMDRDKLRNLLMATGMALSSGNSNNFGPNLMAMDQNRRDQRQRQHGERQQRTMSNMTANGLRKKNTPQAIQIADAIDAGEITGAMGLQLHKQFTDQVQKPTSQIQNFEYAKQNGFTGSFMDWKNSAGSQGAEKFGLNPVFGTNEQGENVLMQPSNRGGGQVMDVDNFTPTSPYDKALQKSSGGAYGKAQGDARSALSKAPAITNAMQKTLEIIGHRGLDQSVGWWDSKTPDVREPALDFATRLKNLKSEAFMAARQELKGAGQVTDFEGMKAEMALNRAERAMGEEDFKAAMMEFYEALERGYRIIEERAGVTEPRDIAPQGNSATNGWQIRQVK